jgi:preprotein translocase subunit SecG
VVERNLDRITIIAGVIWAVCVIGLGVLYRYSG